MKKGLLILMGILLINRVYAQDCSCADNYTWLKETFAENDAGFQMVIDQKGVEEYQKHCDSYAVKVKGISDREQCAEVLLSWLRFFRNGHLWLGTNDEMTDNEVEKGEQAEEIIKRFSDWETYPYKKKEFNSYVSSLAEPGLEGIWSNPPYQLGVKKVDDQYIGFVLEADGVYWRQSQVKFKIFEENGSLSAVYYMRNHSEEQFDEVRLTGNNFLQMGFVTLKRIAPVFQPNEIDLVMERYYKFESSAVPLFEKLNDKTTVLRIPSFSYSEKKLIDSLIEINWELITNTENLIIDLRNNGGGSDAAFSKILPIIYTNPVRTVGVAFLSTPLNNERMAGFVNDTEWSDEERKWAAEALAKLNEHIGEFVNLDSSVVSVETLDTIYPYPKNVGVLINEGNASTTEQFLLAARQSKKVKLFGATTAGVLDVSNMHFVDSPCKDLKLGYGLTVSMRIPEMAVDDIGIQPDYYIDKTIPDYNWIDFVEGVLSQDK